MALVKAYRWEVHPARYPLFALGDIHWDADGCEKAAFKACAASFKWAGPNARAVFLGDAFNFLRKHDRDALLAAIAHMSEEAREAIDRQHMREVKDFLKAAEPFKGKTLLMLEGNHSWIFADGRTTGQVIAEGLGADWADYSSHFTLILRTKGKGEEKTRPTHVLKVYAHHGWGGPRTRTGDIGHFERGCMADHEAALYLMGDSHDLYFMPARPKLDLTTGVPPIQYEISRWFGRTGGFLRGYMPGPRASYIERKGRSPLSIGWLELEISFRFPREPGTKDNRRATRVHIRGEAVSF